MSSVQTLTAKGPGRSAAAPSYRPKIRLTSEQIYDAYSDRILRIGDRLETIVFWLAAAATYGLAKFAVASEFNFNLSLFGTTAVIFAIEAWMFIYVRRSILRSKTFMLAGLYAWNLTFPMVQGPVDRNPYFTTTLDGAMQALALSWLFTACAWTAYFLRGPRAAKWEGTLSKLIPRPTPRAAFWFAVACFVPEIIHRWVMTDWSRVSSVPLALLGADAGAKFVRGQYGDWRAVFLPVSFLWDVFPVVATMAFMKMKGRPEMRGMILLMYLFVVLAQLFSWSRFRLAIMLFSPIALFLLCYPVKRHWRYYALAALLFAFFIPASNLMSSGRQGSWYSRGFSLNFDASKVTENNFGVFTHVLENVPQNYPYKPFYDVYYFTAIGPIPRFVWRDKPWMDQSYLGGLHRHWMAKTIMGETYHHGGIIHLVMFAIVFGFGVRTLDNVFKPTHAMEPTTAILYLACASVVLFFMRSVSGAARQAYPIVALLIVMGIIRYSRGGFVRSPARRRVRLSPPMSSAASAR